MELDPVRVNGEVFLAGNDGGGGGGGMTSPDLLVGAGRVCMMSGGGVPAGYTVFSGMPYQRGAGVGGVFRALMRFLLPIGRQMGSAIGREGLETGQRVLSSYLNGKDLKESLEHESRAGLSNLLDTAANNLKRRGKDGKPQPKDGHGVDFKHYKRAPKATPSRAPSGKSIKRLHSLFGPPILPNKALKTASRKKRKTTRTGGKTKRAKLRVDSLGVY